MKRFIFVIIGIFTLIEAIESSEFGYICYSSQNIGDDIQAIAAKQFLPANAITIDREYLSSFKHASPVKTIVNGWFMHTKSAWYRDGTPPDISWPPSSSIDPLFISIHLTGSFLPLIFSPENMGYLKQHAPIGARDLFTLEELKKRDIPCYFSGCLTLTLDNCYARRDNIIYAVDVSDAVYEYLRRTCKAKVIKISHEVNSQLKTAERLKIAESLLDKYRKAKCVVTSRLHACMPCLAFETPVLFITNCPDAPRYHGLVRLARFSSEEALLTGQIDFSFDTPTENPKSYLKIRNDLIERLTNWVNENQPPLYLKERPAD